MANNQYYVIATKVKRVPKKIVISTYLDWESIQSYYFLYLLCYLLIILSFVYYTTYVSSICNAM